MIDETKVHWREGFFDSNLHAIANKGHDPEASMWISLCEAVATGPMNPTDKDLMRCERCERQIKTLKPPTT